MFLIGIRFCIQSSLISILCLILASPASGTEDKTLSSRLDRIRQSTRLKADELGLVVSRASDGHEEIVWNHRGDQRMIPASLTKILTAGAVLEGLGSSRKFETKLMSVAPIKDGVLEGDLYLLGAGDPGFVSETMWFLVNEFKRTGVRKITGNIIVDESRFDQIRSDPSRQDERVDRAFDAPVGAMSFNWNSINVFVRPGAKVGDRALVTLDPESDYAQLQAEVRTTSGKKVEVSVHRKEQSKGQDILIVKGSIGIDAKEYVAYKNITNPILWCGRNLVSFLNQRGIQVGGQIKSGLTPNSAAQLARAESKPISSMVVDMMKFSNNFVAEMLTKNLAAEKGSSHPATLSEGVQLIRDFVVSAGIAKDRFRIINPSGFSRENQISPKDLNQVLWHIREQFGIFAEALTAFPVAGVDGTLKSRMRGSKAEGRVRAKTGLLNGVAGLAGYAGKEDGTQYTFVFLFNGRPDLSEDARALFDRMAAELVQ